MKIVVTGALGHIGSRVIRSLSDLFENVEIIMIDNMMTQRYSSLFNLPNSAIYKFFEEDVTSVDLLPIIDGSDVVLHLAAITDAAGSFEKKNIVEKNNYETTVKVAEACSAVDSPLIHLSSTSVYGTQHDVVDENCSEEELNPQSPYAETKLKEEKFLIELSKKKRLRFVTCRFGTISGDSPGMRFHTAVNKFCWQATMGQPLTVWRTALHQKRPYLTLDDAVSAIAFIIKKQLFDGRIYNVLTNNHTVNDIINFIKNTVPSVKIEYVDTKIMNQLSYDVSNKRIKDTSFNFDGSLEKSINETLKLLQNSNKDY
jgi:UDP-glucose 4-epimerase